MKKISSLLATILTVFLLFGTSHADLNNGLVAHFPFSGNANDISGQGNHGTVYGATLANDRHGNANSAYSFDGVDDYIEVADDSSLTMGTGNLTISTWVKVSDNSNTHRFVDTGARYYGGYSLFYYSREYAGLEGDGSFCSQWNKLNGVEGQGRQTAGNTYILDGNWHHLVGVWDRDLNTLNTYLDGVLIKSQAMWFSTSQYISNAFDLRIGCEAPGINQLTDGSIDDIRIYNRALDSCEVQELYIQELHN